MAQDRAVARRSSHGGSMSYKDREAQKQKQKEKQEEKEKVQEITKVEAEQIIRGPEFGRAFESMSRIMERALGSEFNLRGDFFIEDDGVKGDDKGERGGKLTRKFTF